METAAVEVVDAKEARERILAKKVRRGLTVEGKLVRLGRRRTRRVRPGGPRGYDGGDGPDARGRSALQQPADSNPR